MSWDHPRGHDSVVATVAPYQALHPDVSISWQTRSLQDFADYPVEKLAEMFDLFLADQAANSVGPSHRSYQAEGHQWAFATDAASQVASYRPDLMERIGAVIPASWDAVVALAESRKGKDAQVAIPLIPVDTLMAFCSICASYGEEPYAGDDVVVSRAMGRHALGLLGRLRDAIHPESLTWNPIRCYDRMS